MIEKSLMIELVRVLVLEIIGADLRCRLRGSVENPTPYFEVIETPHSVS